MQIAIMTDKLDLTAQESQSFWPIYSDYQNDLKAVRKDIENMSNLSGAERLETKKNLQQKKLDIQGQYEEKFKKIKTLCEKLECVITVLNSFFIPKGVPKGGCLELSLHFLNLPT